MLQANVAITIDRRDIANLKPAEAAHKLEQLSLNSTYANVRDLYDRLYIACVLKER